MTPPAAPKEGMAMLVPVCGGCFDSLGDLLPTLKPAAFERQRPQNLPPRLNQSEVRRVLGLKDELESGGGPG